MPACVCLLICASKSHHDELINYLSDSHSAMLPALNENSFDDFCLDFWGNCSVLLPRASISSPSCGSGFRLNDSQSDSLVMIEKIFFFLLTIIATLGCKCKHFCVSLALLGSARQHLIDVSACTGPRQPHMSTSIHACTCKKPQLHNRIASTVATAAEWDPPYFVLLH